MSTQTQTVKEAVFVMQDRDNGISTIVKANQSLPKGAVYQLPPNSGDLITKEDGEERVGILVTTNQGNLISITTPVITSPTNGNVYSMAINSSAFSASDIYTGFHEESDWEIYTDAAGTDLEAFAYKSTTDLRSFSFNPARHDAEYFVRVRYRSKSYVSEWSELARFKSPNTYIVNPIVSIAGNNNAVMLQPTIMCGEFNVINGNDTIDSTIYQVALDSGFNSLVYNNVDKVNLSSLKLPNSLESNTSYFIRVKFIGKSMVSAWSNVLEIKTGAFTDTPIISGPKYVFENTVAALSIDNYNADSVYTIFSTLGVINRIDNKIYITMPSVSTDTDINVSVSCTDVDSSLLPSADCVYGIKILNSGLSSDQALITTTGYNNMYAGNAIANVNLENWFNLDIMDKTQTSIVSRIYIDNLKGDIKVGDVLYANEGEPFTVKTVRDDGNVDSIFNVAAISAGASHVLLLTVSGLVFACGDNTHGQLGVGDTNARTSFVLAGIHAKAICAGHMHSGFLRKDGLLCVCGYNTYGQIGCGDTIDKTNWWVHNHLVKSFDLGVYFTAYVVDGGEGELYTFGVNTNGELGQNITNDTAKIVSTPTLVTKGIEKVACGQYHTMCKTLDGYLGYFGRNVEGQLGNSNNTDAPAFVKTSIDINDVWCTSHASYILKSDSLLYSTGLNAFGQLGLNDLINRNSFVSTGISPAEVYPQQYSIFVKTITGVLMRTGRNINGELMTGDTTDLVKFTELKDVNFTIIGKKGYYNFIGIKEDKIVYGIGRNMNSLMGDFPNPIPVLTPIFDKSKYGLFKTKYWVTPEVNISSTPYRVYSCKSPIKSGEISQDVGDKDFKGLTNLVTTEKVGNVIDPTKISTLSKLFIKDTSLSSGIGDRLITNNGTIITIDSIQDDGNIATVSKIKKISKTQYDICTFILLENGDLYGSGFNHSGQLGLPASVAYQGSWVKILTGIKDVVCGMTNTFVVANDGYVYATGYNLNGSLGVGDNVNKFGFTKIPNIINPKKIVPGIVHTAFIDANNVLLTCGYNNAGQCCDGAYTADHITLYNTGIVVKDVAVSYYSTIFIKASDNKLYGAGSNNSGELGVGAATAKISIKDLSITNAIALKGNTTYFAIKKSDGNVYYAGDIISGISKMTFTVIPGLSGVKNLFAAGERCVYASDADDNLYTFGAGIMNQAFTSDKSYNLSGFGKTSIKAIDVIYSWYGVHVRTPDDKLYFAGMACAGEVGARNGGKSMFDVPTRIFLEYPVVGNYKTNKWVVPKETLKEIPTALYPISGLYVNGIESLPVSATVVDGVATVNRADIEFPPVRNIELYWNRFKNVYISNYTAVIQKTVS